MKATLALAAAVLAVGSLSACSSSGPNTVTPAETSQAASASTPTPTPSPEVKLSGAFGDTITFPSGVAVKAAPPVAVTAAQYAYGAVEGKIVTIDLSVTNGGKEPIEAGLMAFPRVTYGPQGTAAQNANDIQAGIGAASLSTILPGETQTVKLGYGIPAAHYGEIRMEVNGPTFNDKPAIFKGAAQ